MAGGAVFDNVDDQCVLVAIGSDGYHTLHIAGSLALTPNFLAAAGPEHGAALGNRQGQGISVHVSEGQYLFGVVILHDGGDQTVRIKFQRLSVFRNFHSEILLTIR